jgi:hypothetical protein
MTPMCGINSLWGATAGKTQQNFGDIVNLVRKTLKIAKQVDHRIFVRLE